MITITMTVFEVGETREREKAWLVDSYQPLRAAKKPASQFVTQNPYSWHQPFDSLWPPSDILIDDVEFELDGFFRRYKSDWT